MAFEDDFLELMPLTCTLTPLQTRSGIVGENTYNTDSAITPFCHVEYKAETRKDNEGNDKFQMGVVYLDGVHPVDTTWQLVIPIPGGTQEVKIITVDQNTDEDGFHHTAVHFGAL